MDIDTYLSDRITHLKSVEIDYFNKAYKHPEPLRGFYKNISNEFHARRHELELLQREILSGCSVPQGDEP